MAAAARDPDENDTTDDALVEARPEPYMQRQDVALGQLFNLAQDMLCIAGFDGYFKQVNPAWTRVLGWTAEELTSRPFADFVHPDDREKTSAEVSTLADGTETIHFENRYRSRDGSYRWLSWTSSPSAHEKLIYAAARDITLAKNSTQMAAATLAVTTIASQASDWGSAGTLILEAVCHALGWEVGALWLVDDSGESLVWRHAHFATDAARTALGGVVGHERRQRGESLVGLVWERGEPVLTQGLHDDSRFHVPAEVSGGPMGGGFGFPIRGGGEVVGVMAFAANDVQFVDVELRTAALALAEQIETLLDRLAASERMQHMAFHDTLTGLPNLALFRERADHALRLAARSGAPVGIAVADVDRFKHINDTFGHAAGDEVLRHVASCLVSSLRASDTVARLGGDEFGIVLPATSASGVAAAVGKLRKSLAAGIRVGDDRLMVDVSLGYAVSASGQPLDELLRAADAEMYREKERRRSAVLSGRLG